MQCCDIKPLLRHINIYVGWGEKNQNIVSLSSYYEGKYSFSVWTVEM